MPVQRNNLSRSYTFCGLCSVKLFLYFVIMLSIGGYANRNGPMLRYLPNCSLPIAIIGDLHYLVRFSPEDCAIACASCRTPACRTQPTIRQRRTAGTPTIRRMTPKSTRHVAITPFPNRKSNIHRCALRKSIKLM